MPWHNLEKAYIDFNNYMQKINLITEIFLELLEFQKILESDW